MQHLLELADPHAVTVTLILSGQLSKICNVCLHNHTDKYTKYLSTSLLIKILFLEQLKFIILYVYNANKLHAFVYTNLRAYYFLYYSPFCPFCAM